MKNAKLAAVIVAALIGAVGASIVIPSLDRTSDEQGRPSPSIARETPSAEREAEDSPDKASNLDGPAAVQPSSSNADPAPVPVASRQRGSAVIHIEEGVVEGQDGDDEEDEEEEEDEDKNDE